MRRWALIALGALAGGLPLVGVAATATPAGATVPGDNAGITVTGTVTNITTGGGYTLQPTFATTTHDYVVPCNAGTNSIPFTFTGGSPASATVSLVESQALIVQLPDASHQYWIRCLPHDFPAITASAPGAGYTPGYYFTGNLTTNNSIGAYAMVLDQNGTPVWYQPTPAPAGVQLLPNDTLAWSPVNGPGVGATPGEGFQYFHLDNQTVTQQPSPVQPPDLHELDRLANGDVMQLATPLRTCSGTCPSWFSNTPVNPPNSPPGDGHTYVDCIVQEIDPAGNLVWSWDADNHLEHQNFSENTLHAVVSPYGTSGQTVADPYHCNSIDVDPTASNPRNGDVIISMRNTSAIYRINRSDVNIPNGKIVWKLGGYTSTNPPAVTLADGEQSLTFTSDDAGEAGTGLQVGGFIGGQHDARFRPSGDVSLYDDHTGYTTGAARGVEYHVDTGAGTATMNWEYKEPGGIRAGATGSTRRYGGTGGDNVIAWGFKNPGVEMSEVKDDGSVLLTFTFPGGINPYRILKVPTNGIDINLLRQTAGIPRPTPAPTGPGWNQPSEVTLSGPPGPGASPTGAARPVAPGSGWIDTFWKGNDGNLWHTWTLNNGATWAGGFPLGGGPLNSDPHPVSSAPGRIDVFWKGTDNGLWHKWFVQGIGWNGPQSLGGSGTMASDPMPVSSSSGAIDVFWKGTDNALHHKWYFDGGGWNGPMSLGSGPLNGTPNPVSAGPGRIDVFWKGTDNGIWHDWFWPNIGWSGPGSLGSGPLGSDPHPVSPRQGVIDMFWQGNDQALWHDWFFDGGGWNGPQSLGGAGTVVGDPFPVSSSGNFVSVFWTGPNSGLLEARYIPGSGWSQSPAPSSSPLGSDPHAISATAGNLIVFDRSFDGNLWFQTSTGTPVAPASVAPARQPDPSWPSQV